MNDVKNLIWGSNRPKLEQSNFPTNKHSFTVWFSNSSVFRHIFVSQIWTLRIIPNSKFIFQTLLTTCEFELSENLTLKSLDFRKVWISGLQISDIYCVYSETSKSRLVRILNSPLPSGLQTLRIWNDGQLWTDKMTRILTLQLVYTILTINFKYM